MFDAAFDAMFDAGFAAIFGFFARTGLEVLLEGVEEREEREEREEDDEDDDLSSTILLIPNV